MYSTLLCLVILACTVWLWRDSLRAREVAARVSRRACESEGVQFLDETVSLATVRPLLGRGGPCLRRCYQFEFSRRGDDRQAGTITITAGHVETIYLTPSPDPGPGPAPPRTATVVHLDGRRRH